MSDWLLRYGVWLFIGIPTVCYACQAALVYWPKGERAMAGVMLGYCMANLFFMARDLGYIR